MDEQLLELMRDRFDRLDTELSSLNVALRDHTKMDEQYWKKIDANEAQIGVLKWLFSGVSASGVLAWIYTNFAKH